MTVFHFLSNLKIWRKISVHIFPNFQQSWDNKLKLIFASLGYLFRIGFLQLWHLNEKIIEDSIFYYIKSSLT